ncbi:hypothetical protein TSTA_101970 [Talaromyces stipitatus ATCC 10500]|uniref:Uncharacterized protein n=1 Tax=Talaromyces stipitatus (strain ATCC 10500 / CBS 375.48 / QM 6759 / NRRL 1006) TaxID=441959 RepID=B8MN12_TALSN|nr:uncharacterized protein TSTA_101970 [Talaromyces stipitatus ATCC 10500]EED13961.1 hypothetical protein TSTA_101970 [Talaromyces stipitatus ATCC 10500]
MDSTTSKFDRERYFYGYAKRLVRVFEIEGCNCLEPEHHIAVQISDDILTQSLSRTHISLEQLKESSDPPLLDLGPDVKLLCTQGKHRLEACHLSSTLWTQLCEESSNEKPFSDAIEPKGGSIDSHKPQLCHGFDQLLPYGALWKGFTADNFRTVLDMGHHEVGYMLPNRLHTLISDYSKSLITSIEFMSCGQRSCPKRRVQWDELCVGTPLIRNSTPPFILPTETRTHRVAHKFTYILYKSKFFYINASTTATELDPCMRARICELHTEAHWGYKRIHRAHPEIPISTTVPHRLRNNPT